MVALGALGVGGDRWCPRCLETTHWEDQCWVEATAVICHVCNLPGHLPCIHQATDFRQRKLVIDTFGWLPFKEWFQVRSEVSPCRLD